MQKNRFLYMAAVLIVGCAHGSDFGNRVQAGNAASTTAAGKNYERSLGPAVRDAMRFCIPPGSSSPANLGTFTFVANVNGSGAVSNAEVQPKTEVSQCFSERFSQTQLPKPPDGSYGAGYPITIEMRVKP